MLMGTIHSLNPPNHITGRLRLLFLGTGAFLYINFRKDDEHMKTKCKRLLSLLLVFVLVLGLMPSVYAATDDGTQPTTEPVVTEATTEPVGDTEPTVPDTTGATEATDPSESTEGTEETEAPTESEEEETEPPEDSDEDWTQPLKITV